MGFLGGVASIVSVLANQIGGYWKAGKASGNIVGLRMMNGKCASAVRGLFAGKRVIGIDKCALQRVEYRVGE